LLINCRSKPRNTERTQCDELRWLLMSWCLMNLENTFPFPLMFLWQVPSHF
jgi:hypothetical protein